MLDWLLKNVLQWVIDNLGEDKLKQWADALKNYVIPALRSAKDKLIAAARAEAAKSETPIDDALVDALDKFLEALLPDNPSTL